MCIIMKWISSLTNVHAESTGKASIRGFASRYPLPVSLWRLQKCLFSIFTGGSHQGDIVAGVTVLPSACGWLDLTSRVCTAALVPAQDSLGGPEPQHSPLLLQSSCAILATILYLKIASPRPRAIAYFSVFSFLASYSLRVPLCSGSLGSSAPQRLVSRCCGCSRWWPWAASCCLSPSWLPRWVCSQLRRVHIPACM